MHLQITQVSWSTAHAILQYILILQPKETDKDQDFTWNQ